MQHRLVCLVNVARVICLLLVTDVASSSSGRLGHHPSTQHRATHAHSSTTPISAHASAAPALATLPLLPFPAAAGAFPGGFCGLGAPAPVQMYPPYIFMGFPLHPHLLQSYAAAAGVPESTVTHPAANPAKRKSTEPAARSPGHEKLRRTSSYADGRLHSVAHAASRDRKQSSMTSSGGRGCADVRQGATQFDQDGALDLTRK